MREGTQHLSRRQASLKLLGLILLAISTCFFRPSLGGGGFLLQPTVWKDIKGDPLPFQSLEAIEEYLRTAQIVEKKRIPIGTTGASRLRLEKGGVQVCACFRDISIDRRSMRLESGKTEFDFRDEALFEVAAYKLGKLLGLNNIPPVVERKVNDTDGTLQIWVGAAMMEEDRLERKLQPPNIWNWGMQIQIVRLFDNLIYNDDRSPENLLIDADWKVWMIDHTRAFRKHRQLPDAEAVTACERGVWEKLSNLDEGTVRLTLGPYLKGWEMNGLLERMARLVAHIRGLIELKGEGRVLYRLWTTPSPDCSQEPLVPTSVES